MNIVRELVFLSDVLYNIIGVVLVERMDMVNRERTKPNFGVDIDGVIMDTSTVYLEYISKVTGKEYNIDDVTDYFFEDCIGVSPEELNKAVEMITNDRAWQSIPLLPGAIEGLRLINEYFNMYIVTARPPEAQRDTRRWFAENHFKPIDIIFTDLGTKLGFLKEKNIQLDFYIEDRWEFAEEIASTGTRVYLMDYPWNRRSSEGLNIMRVNGWQDAIEDFSQEIA